MSSVFPLEHLSPDFGARDQSTGCLLYSSSPPPSLSRVESCGYVPPCPANPSIPPSPHPFLHLRFGGWREKHRLFVREIDATDSRATKQMFRTDVTGGQRMDREWTLDGRWMDIVDDPN